MSRTIRSNMLHIHVGISKISSFQIWICWFIKLFAHQTTLSLWACSLLQHTLAVVLTGFCTQNCTLSHPKCVVLITPSRFSFQLHSVTSCNVLWRRRMWVGAPKGCKQHGCVQLYMDMYLIANCQVPGHYCEPCIIVVVQFWTSPRVQDMKFEMVGHFSNSWLADWPCVQSECTMLKFWLAILLFFFVTVTHSYLVQYDWVRTAYYLYRVTCFCL